MSLNKMIIPDTLKVGYQNRTDTYTGKLAYVTYVDSKGVHRKVESWNSWRDKKIEPSEFKNEPMSGFVLNKKTGDYKGSWNGRMAWIRIYDPRGFEFEIQVDNLLFILQETSAVKGKGLEGEFIYAWDGKDLVLLPTSCQEYQDSYKFTTLNKSSVSKQDIIPGYIYLNKNNQKVMYIGRENVVTYGNKNYDNSSFSIKKMHIFKYMDSNDKTVTRTYDSHNYMFMTDFKKIGEKISTSPDLSFPDLYDEFKKSKYESSMTKIQATEKYLNFENKNQYYRDHVYYKYNDTTYYRCNIDCNGDNCRINFYGILTINNDNSISYNHSRYYNYYNEFNLIDFESMKHIFNVKNNGINRWYGAGRTQSYDISASKESISTCPFYKIEGVNEFGSVCITY